MNLFELFAKLTLDTSEYESGMSGAASLAESVGDRIGSALQTAAKVGTAALSAASAAVGALTKQAVDGFADYEQLAGGIETLFGDAADTVKENAEKAYETAGMSANDYMEMVTSFAGALLKSTSNTTQKATEQDTQALSDALDKQYDLRQKAYSKQETALKRTLDKQYKMAQKSYDKQYQAAQKAFDKQYQAMSDAIDDEIEKRQKSYDKKEAALQKSQDREIAALEKATDKRLELIDKEYNAAIKAIDKEQAARLKNIDDQIAAITGASEAEQKAREQQVADDKKAELEKALSVAKTQSRREEIQKELTQFLEDEAYKQREAARRAQIEQLKDQKDAIKEEASNRKTAAKEDRDEKVDAVKKSSAAQLSALKEANKRELEALKEKDKTELENFKKAKKNQLAALRESQQERLSAMRESQQDELERLIQSQEDQLAATKEHHSDLLKELKKSISEQKKELKSGADEATKNTKVTAAQQREAAKLADLAIVDMSDNVNKLGTNMDMVQNAYKGFSRGNFTMLDNLQLGFAGTKEGMQELLNRAEQISGYKYDISSYGDIVNAIHVVQTEMGITGTTQREAESTIQGSLSRLKAAWSNMVTSFGRDDADLSKNIDQTIEAAKTYINNLKPVVVRAIKGIGTFVGEIGPVVKQELPPLMNEIAPLITSAAIDLLSGIISTLPTIVQTIAEQLPPVIQQLWDTIIALVNDYSPELADTLSTVGDYFSSAFEWISTHGDEVTGILKAIFAGFIAFKTITGIIKAVSAAQAVLNVVMAANPIGLIVIAVAGLITALVALWTTNEDFRKAVKKIWSAITGFFVGAWKKIKETWNAVTGFFSGVWTGIKNIFANVGNWFKEKFVNAKNVATNAWSNAKQKFSEIWGNIKSAFANVTTWFKDKFTSAKEKASGAWNNAKSVFSKVWDKVKSGFSISDAWSWGQDMIDNFIGGIYSMWNNLTTTLSNFAQTIRDYIGFSEPKKGPLSVFHSFSPDMMKLFAQGIRENEDIITNQIKKSFDFSDLMNNGLNASFDAKGMIGYSTASQKAPIANYNTFNIYQQPGENMYELAERIGQILNNNMSRERATFA